MPYSVELSQHNRVQQLKAQAERGEIELPLIDPTDPAAMSALSPQQLEMVTAGLYLDAATAPAEDGPAVVLPEGWAPDRLRQVQRDFPDDWRSAVRSLGGQA